MTYFKGIISTLEGDTLCTDVVIRIEQLPPYRPASKPWWKGQFNVPSRANFDPLLHHHLTLGFEDGRCLNVRLTGLATDSQTVYFKSSDDSA